MVRGNNGQNLTVFNQIYLFIIKKNYTDQVNCLQLKAGYGIDFKFLFFYQPVPKKSEEKKVILANINNIKSLRTMHLVL